MGNLIDGRSIAEKVYVDLRREIADLKSKGVTPGIAVVLVGDNPASRTYVRSKDKMSRELGLHSIKLERPASTTQSELLERVEELNRDPKVHGILIQSPPPKQIDEAAIVRALDPRKDVDGFHPLNVAKLAMGDPTGFVPCTPLGVQRLLIESKIDIAGAHVVVLGRSRSDADRDVNVEHSQSRADVQCGLAIFLVSNRRIHGLIFARRNNVDAVFGDRTAARASRLIQSRPRYMARWARANCRSAD